MPNNTAAAEMVDSLKKKEISFIEEFLEAINRAREKDQWLQDDVFVEILSVGMRFAALTAADLSRDESISRSAVSKWINHTSVPAFPTRKTVVLWIEKNLKERVNTLRGQVNAQLENTEPISDLQDVA